MPPGDLQGEILARSTELFARKGFDGVTIREIAAACRITLPTIYYYFRDKRGLYETVVLEAFARRNAELLTAISQGPQTPREQLKILFRTLVRQPSHGFDQQIIDREMLAGERDRLHIISQKVVSPAFQEVCRIVAEIAPRVNAPQMTFLLFSLAYGAVKLMPLRPELPDLADEPLDSDALALHLWEQAIRWLTGETPVPRASDDPGTCNTSRHLAEMRRPEEATP